MSLGRTERDSFKGSKRIFQVRYAYILNEVSDYDFKKQEARLWET